jgi:integrase
VEVKQRAPVDYASSGSVRLPIYFSPLKKKLPGGGNGGGAATVPESPRFKIYDSWVIYFYEKGRRKKRRFPALSAAKKKGKTLAEKLDREGSHTIVLPQADCRVYTTAKEILQVHGMEVDAGARLLHETLSRLKGASMNQMVDFFNAHGRRVLVSASSLDSYAAYQKDMEQRGVSKYHQRDVRRFVGAFVKVFPDSLVPVTTSEIDGWLAKLGGNARSKNNGRDKIIAFFNFLEKKNYLPKGGAATAKATTPFNDPRQIISSEEEAAASVTDTDIYTPEEMGKILSLADPEVRVTMEIKGFSGIRTEELARLWWVLINEGSGYISITEAIAKVNQRTVPMPENLKTRLKAYAASMKKDRVSKTWRSANALYHVWKRATDVAEVPYKKNGFRNSFISYRLALTKDINLVAYESGNSPEMIRKFYLDLATPEQAKAWFNL